VEKSHLMPTAIINPIFGGISGARLPIAEYDLGEGAVLRPGQRLKHAMALALKSSNGLARAMMAQRLTGASVSCACQTCSSLENEKGDNAFEFPPQQRNLRSLRKGYSQPSLHGQ
jgi:hypothetical protein